MGMPLQSLNSLARRLVTAYLKSLKSSAKSLVFQHFVAQESKPSLYHSTFHSACPFKVINLQKCDIMHHTLLSS